MKRSASDRFKRSPCCQNIAFGFKDSAHVLNQGVLRCWNLLTSANVVVAAGIVAGNLDHHAHLGRPWLGNLIQIPLAVVVDPPAHRIGLRRNRRGRVSRR